jgi:methyl-accepting chemotaxis protein
MFNLASPRRAVLGGIAGFLAAFGVMALLPEGWLAPLAGSRIAIMTLLAMLAGLLTAGISAAAVMHVQRQEIIQLRMTTDSMPQGLCMFDANERLVVCNTQYYRMYALTPDDVKKGSTLSEVLKRRVAKGTFSRDPEQYRQEFVAAIRQGRTTRHDVKLKDGRDLLVMNHPVEGGGWIGVHEDVTERRASEQQQTALQLQEQRRMMLEGAISTFRLRAESLLHSVTERATEMRSMAAELSNASGASSRSAEMAVSTSNGALLNVDQAAAAVDELSTSISVIARRLTEGAQIVRGAADEAQATNTDINALSQAAQRIGDVVKLIRSIAGQTNLLALNATIEAARAGEAGRGFAVVAAEVKNLAAQTEKATQDISGQIKEVQNSVAKAVEAIGNITHRMDDINARSSEIAASVEEQSAVTAEISRNVSEAADGSKRVAGVLTEVSASTAKSRQSVEIVLSAAAAVEEAAADLRTQVDTFLRDVAA